MEIQINLTPTVNAVVPGQPSGAKKQFGIVRTQTADEDQ